MINWIVTSADIVWLFVVLRAAYHLKKGHGFRRAFF